ncbi:MAG TPA: CAP domain-containing protein [Gaiellaceae bacterium]|jgi:uncharacterized protein YkwD|nr:CAP domain-containing protein [Gaiellaceae bacterium]
MSEKRRILSVVALLLVLSPAVPGTAAAADSTPPTTTAATSPSAGEYAILRAMNGVRTANGVPALSVGPKLQRAARAHSVDMARRGYFDHGLFVQRLRRFGVRARYLGENLAYGSGPGFSAAVVVRMWLASPPHRATLLDRGFRRVGVGLAGRTTRLVTADFAG